MTDVERVKLRIYGRVQGVFFRATAREVAESLELHGWVKNCDDGSVEAVVEGSQERVKEFIDWAHSGPEQAKVDRVDIDREVSVPEVNVRGFEIRR